MHTVTLALTPGEPAGIGPDITVKLAQTAHSIPLVVYADPELLLTRAEQLGLPLTLHSLDIFSPDVIASLALLPAGELYVRPFLCKVPAQSGVLEIGNAEYVLQCLEAATQDCLRYPDRIALVTGPIQKSIINDAGVVFSGHTEFLQEQSGVDKVVMMLATDTLRVALVTTHMALRDVADAVTPLNVQRTLDIVDADMRRYFTATAPEILVCGLNPHAGENGHLGSEEQDIIEPVLARLRRSGMRLTGPVPADTAFTPGQLQGIDVVVAMYHDQGLPVLKAQGFGNAINVTLGLPFIRTSVDHGTALSLAGTGKANEGSLQQAVRIATAMLERVAA